MPTARAPRRRQTDVSLPRTILLLGSGELGREFVISAKRLGCRVIAVDRYAGAPAMQVADESAVIDMLDGAAIRRLVRAHEPDFVVPEIEAIRTEELLRIEARGTTVIPSARAAHLTMNRDAIRSLAAEELRLPTARYAFANSVSELEHIVTRNGQRSIGLPCVVKPIMSSSGKGQSIASTKSDLARCWKTALEGMRGDTIRVIAEELIRFDSEITLLTVKQRPEVGGTIFVNPIGHRQERGDYQESWIPHPMSSAALRSAQRMAKRITDRIAGKNGAGLFGVEFFLRGNQVIFSELSPRPHDTGMVTMVSQDLSEFDLHLRAILGLPIPRIEYRGPSASAVILAKGTTSQPHFRGLAAALQLPRVEIRLFGKPTAHKNRRMGVALASATSISTARSRANKAAGTVSAE
jgi:phosphoribosylglycinamide formyltransferase 2